MGLPGGGACHEHSPLRKAKRQRGVIRPGMAPIAAAVKSISPKAAAKHYVSSRVTALRLPFASTVALIRFLVSFVSR